MTDGKKEIFFKERDMNKKEKKSFWKSEWRDPGREKKKMKRVTSFEGKTNQQQKKKKKKAKTKTKNKKKKGNGKMLKYFGGVVKKEENPSFFVGGCLRCLIEFGVQNERLGWKQQNIYKKKQTKQNKNK